MGKTRQSFVLKSDCTSFDDQGLRAFLSGHEQADVQIDATALRRLDIGLVELLLAAALWWRQRELTFELTGLSPSLEQRLDLLDLRAGMFGQKVDA